MATTTQWKARCAQWAFPDGSLYSNSATCPAPSKNFMQIYITETDVILRTWKVLPPTRPDSNQAPMQLSSDYSEFFDDEKMRGDLERGLGVKELEYIDRLISGKIDYLNRLPDKLSLKIISKLDLLSTVRLGMVNKYFNEICSSNELWAKIYTEYNRSPVSQELLMLVDEKGWKQVFFMNKLQLQMLMRRHTTGKEMQRAFFLTSEEEGKEDEEDYKVQQDEGDEEEEEQEEEDEGEDIEKATWGEVLSSSMENLAIGEHELSDPQEFVN